MSYEMIVKETEARLKKITAGFEAELAKLRTSRPSTTLVEDLEAECYGKMMPLKSLGLISLSQEREIIIKPWDASYLEPIEKAVHQSDLGLSPITEEGRVRIPFPTLSEDRRERYLKILSGKLEEAKRRVRDARNNGKKKIETAFSKGELGEDDKFRAIDEVQEAVDETNKRLGEMRKKKEKQIKGS